MDKSQRVAQRYKRHRTYRWLGLGTFFAALISGYVLLLFYGTLSSLRDPIDLIGVSTTFVIFLIAAIIFRMKLSEHPVTLDEAVSVRLGDAGVAVEEHLENVRKYGDAELPRHAVGKLKAVFDEMNEWKFGNFSLTEPIAKEVRAFRTKFKEHLIPIAKMGVAQTLGQISGLLSAMYNSFATSSYQLSNFVAWTKAIDDLPDPPKHEGLGKVFLGTSLRRTAFVALIIFLGGPSLTYWARQYYWQGQATLSLPL